jgi:hypothetical protein
MPSRLGTLVAETNDPPGFDINQQKLTSPLMRTDKLLIFSLLL